MEYQKRLFIIAAICFLFLFACGPKPMAPQAALDTPEHHVSNGNKLLKAGKIEGAYTEFNRAMELNPKFSPAYVGLGLVYGLKADFKNAFSAMKKASKYAEGPQQEVDVHVGKMRVYLMGQEKIDPKWLKKIEKLHRKAVKIAPESPAAYFYLGLAYKNAFEFRKAAQAFTDVLNLDKAHVEEADRQYAIIQKIERAMPGSIVGKKIAIMDKISRADIAALFIQELKVDELFQKRAPKQFDTTFKTPEDADAADQEAVSATDIAEHVLKVDIDAVIAAGINGLQPYPDNTFRPENIINRAEFAMMIEDIIITITRDDKLATRFFGNSSPFPDLRNDLPFFNAVMVVTTRGIMVTKDAGTGEFDPRGLVSGADALLSIRTLKGQLDKY